MAVFLLSGGLDSVTLMYWVKKHPYMFGLDTGSKHFAIHFRTGLAIDGKLTEFCRYHCERLFIPYEEVDLKLWPEGTRARGEAPADFEDPVPSLVKSKDDEYWEKDYDYQDGRGILFFTYATILAATHDMNVVFVGHQSDLEENTMAVDETTEMKLDSGEEFIDAYTNLMYNGGFLPKRAPEIIAPYLLMGMKKNDIWALASELGVEESKTLSCEFSWPPCGKCSSCRLRERAKQGILEKRA